MSFVKMHQACPSAECGSSDACGINEDGSAYCFSCSTRFKNYEEAISGNNSVADFKQYKNNKVNIGEGEFIELSDRSISLQTAKKYGVKAIKEDGEVVKHYYPYYTANEIAGYKVRKKIGTDPKNFNWEGDSRSTGFFGQQLCQEGGRFLTVVEGECDAMAAYELMGSQYPVVSIKNGAAGAERDFKANLEFIEKFQTIIISFDNDKEGRKAAREVAKLITPGKAKILQMPEDYKDANDMLRQGLHNLYVSCWWSSNIYTPSGVLNISDNFDKLLEREKKDSIPYPWEGLNKKLFGLRQGELVTFTGGTGLGKSSIIREIEHWLITKTEDNIGIVALEEDWTRTADGILSVEANQKLDLDHVREEFGRENYKMLAERVLGGENKNRMWVHAHFGASDFDDILSKIKYMIVGCDCKWIVLDHLQMIVAGNAEQSNERLLLDRMMKDLRKIVEETGAGLLVVSHLKRLEGNRGHEEGAIVSLSHIKGSGGIAQISDCVIALERNQQDSDPVKASTTRLRVLKSRYTGDVGVATHLGYDKNTGRLNEVFFDDDEDDHDEFEL